MSDILRGSGPLQPELEHQAAFEDGGVPERFGDSCKEAVEDEKLAPASKVGATSRGGAETLL